MSNLADRIRAAADQQEARIEEQRKARTPEEREKVLRRAQGLVNEGADVNASVGHPEVLRVARFLVGEPG